MDNMILVLNRQTGRFELRETYSLSSFPEFQAELERLVQEHGSDQVKVVQGHWADVDGLLSVKLRPV